MSVELTVFLWYCGGVFDGSVPECQSMASVVRPRPYVQEDGLAGFDFDLSWLER